MDLDTTVGVVTAVLVVCTVVATGPLSPVAGDGRPSLDDGTATVDAVEVTEGATFSPGRFGTGVVYFRTPSVRVDLAAVKGTPRLVYRVRVPGLGFDRVRTELVDAGTRKTTLTAADRAFDPAAVDETVYRARLTVRLQSFSTDRTVFDRNRSVPVSGGETT